MSAFGLAMCISLLSGVLLARALECPWITVVAFVAVGMQMVMHEIPWAHVIELDGERVVVRTLARTRVFERAVLAWTPWGRDVALVVRDHARTVLLFRVPAWNTQVSVLPALQEAHVALRRALEPAP